MQDCSNSSAWSYCSLPLSNRYIVEWYNVNSKYHFLFFNSLRPSDAYICISKLTIIGSNKGLLSGWRQAIIWTNDGILLIGPLATNFSEILIKTYRFSFKKMHLKMSSGKWRPLCLGLNVLKPTILALSIDNPIIQCHLSYQTHHKPVQCLHVSSPSRWHLAWWNS